MKNAGALMIIAAGEQAEIIVRSFRANPVTVFKLMGLAVVDRDMRGQEILGSRVTSCREDMMSFAVSHVIDEVLISIPGDPGLEEAAARELLSIGLAVHICGEQYCNKLPNCRYHRLLGMNVASCRSREIPLWMALGKGIMDFFGGLVGALLAVIIGIFMGPVIYAASPGPILFSQMRVGKNGRKFRMYKFRSMYMDAEERKKDLLDQNKMKGQMFKLDNDPRVIPGIGHFLRKTSLDEFPQFFNVLRGDMSLVGTRPPTVEEYEAYEFCHNKRLAMKPGLTGLWQISGRSDISDFEEVVKLDGEYIDSWSIGKDIRIIVKTVLAMFAGKGI